MQKLIRACAQALEISAQHFQAAGCEGRDIVGRNRFGEQALRLDRELEAVVLDYFRAERFPFRVVSEEHGVVESSAAPRYLLTLDGIDGSYHYLHDLPEGHFGTMLSLFDNLTPKYSEVAWAGVMQHKFCKLHQAPDAQALKNIGTVQDLRELELLVLDREGAFSRENNFSELDKLGDDTLILKSWTSILLPFLNGAKIAAVICTRKNCIEIPILYKLVTQAGGVMLTAAGRDLGERSYLEHSQDLMMREPMVIAATRDLALQLIARL